MKVSLQCRNSGSLNNGNSLSGGYLFFYVYLILWFIFNLIFLTDYPFVHTDEPWLSGLSRTMIESGSLNTTEDFFDLYERNPHGIKINFHLLQILFITAFGYSIFSVRLLSLLSGMITLLITFKTISRLNPGNRGVLIALITTIILSLDIQFIYISHFARQEIILIALISAIIYIFLCKDHKDKCSIKTGILTGLAAGTHPNGFIIACMVGLYLLSEVLFKKRTIKELIIYILVTGCVTSIFVGLSFYFNPNFIADYRDYGEPLGVLDTPGIKIYKLPDFYRKIFFQIRGTYHVPNIKLQMIIFPLLLIYNLLKRRLNLVITMFAGFNIGLVIIGKYSQPSISFLLPLYYIALSTLVRDIIGCRWTILKALTTLIPLITITMTISTIGREEECFKDYKLKLTSISEDSTILGNLLHDYIVPDGQMYDWRNLSFLEESIGNYINKNEIDYIIISDELEYIFNNRPVWNVLYGNIYNWYPDLLKYIKNNTELITSFDSPSYGNRISALRYLYPWRVSVYRVNQIESIME